jgi:hypothetical protein
VDAEVRNGSSRGSSGTRAALLFVADRECVFEVE